MQWRIERLEVAGSTNDLAQDRVLALWKEGGGEPGASGLVVTARRQTGGRGQHGRRWESPAGGLYLSAVVENIPLSVRGKLALLAGVAVADALEATDGKHDIKLRWPNDLMIGDKKLGGILCEAVAMGQDRWAAIIGIGINVATKIEEFPPALRGQVISLTDCAPRSAPGSAGGLHTVDGALQKILEHLTREVKAFHQTPGAETDSLLRTLMDRVRARDSLRGRQIVLQVGDKECSGVAAGIGDQGELLLRTADTSGITAVEVGTVISVDGRRVRE